MIEFNVLEYSIIISTYLCVFSFYVIFTGLFFIIRKFVSIQFINFFFIFILGLLLILNYLMANNIIFNAVTYVWETSNFLLFKNSLNFSLNFSLNILSFSFSFLVILIGMTTNIYTLNYFRGESNESNFIFLINTFIISMLILVYANNFYTLFLGWECIGLTSFFLINFWNTRRGTLKASFKAFTFNAISDIFLLISFVCLYHSTNTTDCSTLYYILLWEGINDYYYFNLGIIFLCLCASIKSVQILGHLWLPDSMEAPVPASALIHSATLVSAGIYLLCKFNYLYSLLSYNSLLITLGAITAAYGGVVAASQTDLKKLLAYSTMSHCGFLWVLACTGNFFITILYLFLHGIFKAATFYCVGSFIRFFGTQDSRLMGNASVYLPFEVIFLIVCSANLAGLPFTIGSLYKFFFFKLLVLEQFNYFSIGFLFIGLLSGIIYFFRLVFYSSFDFYKNWKHIPLKHILLNRNKTNDKVYLTQTNHIIAVLILLVFAIIIYMYMYINLQQVIVEMENTNLTINYSFENFFLLTQLYMSYLIFFYYFYLFILFILLVIMWRKNIFFSETTLIVVYLILILLLLMIWGHIMTEANTLNNFNFGFSTYKSDILIHLSQWQYWWWFWFSFFWALYFFIIIRCLNKRTFQFNPILNTSIRGHGKWGDFLVAFIPLSWCGNILVNSNFILRMIEWQNESSLFVLRIQGKQWYWVYKFDALASQSILAAPKNIGENKWLITTPNESYCADSYYQAINLGAQLEYKKLYFKFLGENKITKQTINSFSNKAITLKFFNNNFFKNIKSNSLEINNFNINHGVLLRSFNYYDFLLLDDTSNFAANLIDSLKKKPLNILKGVLNKHNLELLKLDIHDFEKNILFIPKFNKLSGSSEVKVEDSEMLWGFRQKKYKRLQKYKFSHTPIYNPVTFEKISTGPIVSALTLKSTLLEPITISDIKNSSTQHLDEIDAFNYHKSIKYNRHRSELVPVVLARRLLRTKRTLVLPAHVNITLITNSYDVVHSWFIPGLGLKLDCVPGRSTHHTFYIDNIGFYYGQCAEICGRYHHHMPIRLCALPYEQFLVWWQRKGVKRMYRIGLINNPKQNVNPNDIKFRYVW